MIHGPKHLKISIQLHVHLYYKGLKESVRCFIFIKHLQLYMQIKGTVVFMLSVSFGI